MKPLKWIPHNEWPKTKTVNPSLFNMWLSDDYAVRAYREKDGIVRLSVTGVGPDARADGNDIPWCDLQAIKSACGYGSFDALEAFPPEVDVRSGAGNARYLWILPKGERLPFIWRNAGHQLGIFRDLIKGKEEQK